MIRQLLPYLPVILAAALCACRPSPSQQPRENPDPAPAPPGPAAAARPDSRPATPDTTSFTGTLRGNIAAVGGDTTGWIIEGDAQTGGIEIDVSNVRDRAKALDGKRVTVTGRLTTRGYVERRNVQVLVADSIEEEQPPGQPGRSTH
jgi:hypothetical protein